MQWDVFLSHANEDKEDFARPLANRLRDLGLRVWFDEFTLTVGDSLRTSIDKGLAGSRYGIVVISPDFLRKHWPQQELNGLAARQVDGVKVILPVWHNISAAEVRGHSPMLADTLAVLSSTGLENVAKELLRAIGRDEERPVNDREKTGRKADLIDSRETPASAAAHERQGVNILFGESESFQIFERGIHIRIHTIRIAVKNNYSDRPLTNCILKITRLSGELSYKAPIEMKHVNILNPQDIIYMNFASLDESNIAYEQDERKYAIQVYFPVNPLPSDKSNWLDHEPYELELTATAAESPPHVVKAKLFVDAGRLKLIAINE